MVGFKADLNMDPYVNGFIINSYKWILTENERNNLESIWVRIHLIKLNLFGSQYNLSYYVAILFTFN